MLTSVDPDRANVGKRVGERDLIRTFVNADRVSKTVRRGIEDVDDILRRVRHEAPTAARREAHSFNAGLRLNTRCDLLAARIDDGDTSLSLVHHIQRVAERGESDRSGRSARLEILDLREFLNVDDRECAVVLVGDERETVVTAEVDLVMTFSGC